MEHFPIATIDGAWQIQGIPDATLAVKLSGAKAKRLSDLSLHKVDLEFAHAALQELQRIGATGSYITRESLWRSALLHFAKCFGDGARFQLDAREVYKAEPPLAFEAFEYFKSLRNKHVVHDENAYSQAIAGAALNDGSKQYKVEKVVCLVTTTATLDAENFSNLCLLIQKALDWTIRKFDAQCEHLCQVLEQRPYEELANLPRIEYRKPDASAMHTKRSAA